MEVDLTKNMKKIGKELDNYLSKHGQKEAIWVKVDDPEYPYRLKCWNCGEIDDIKSKTGKLTKGHATLCSNCFYSLPNLQL